MCPLCPPVFHLADGYQHRGQQRVAFGIGVFVGPQRDVVWGWRCRGCPQRPFPRRPERSGLGMPSCGASCPQRHHSAWRGGRGCEAEAQQTSTGRAVPAEGPFGVRAWRCEARGLRGRSWGWGPGQVLPGCSGRGEAPASQPRPAPLPGRAISRVCGTFPVIAKPAAQTCPARSVSEPERGAWSAERGDPPVVSAPRGLWGPRHREPPAPPLPLGQPCRGQRCRDLPLGLAQPRWPVLGASLALGSLGRRGPLGRTSSLQRVCDGAPGRGLTASASSWARPRGGRPLPAAPWPGSQH